ncbi:MAG: hypothetical protein Tsb0018_05010 [Opitutales bacterium]
MGDATRETGLSQVRHNVPTNQVHESEPSFNGRSVENQKTESKSLLSYLASPIETVKNIYDRLVHTEEELSLRDEAQLLSDPSVSREDKKAILDKLTGNIDGLNKKALTFAALSVVSNSNLSHEDRLALVQSLGEITKAAS